MDAFHKLIARRSQIVEQITALGPMRMGSVREQYLPYKRRDGSIRQRGPYLTYTFKHEGKTRGKHLRNSEEAGRYQRQIETYRRYQELSAELVQVSQTLADLEASDDERCKKNSKN